MAGTVPASVRAVASTAGRGPRLAAGRCLLAGAGLLAASCAPKPVEEVHQFSVAAETVRASAQPLLDDIAAAERANRRRAIALGARLGGDGCAGTWIGGPDETRGFASRFCAEDAPYYADIGDPPVTAALRHGLDVVVDFAGALWRLTAGEAARAETAQVQRLAHEFGALAAVVSGPFGPASGAAAAGAAIGPVVEQLAPVVRTLLRERDARRARDAILANEATVNRLIGALVHGAARADRILNVQVALDVQRGPVSAPVDPSRVERVGAYRRLLANYIAMLQRARGLWQAVVDAAQAPAGSGAAPIADRLADIRADAEAFRRAYASIRTPRP